MKALFYLLLIVPIHCFGGSNDFDLRNYWMPYAAAAYDDNPNRCFKNVESLYDLSNHSISLYRQYTTFCDSLNDTCSGYTALDKYYLNLIIAFKGTTKFEQFFLNNSSYEEMVPFVFGSKVNKKFLEAFNEVWIRGGIKDDVLTLKNRYRNLNVVLVGHSSGGAMAALAAMTVISTGIIPDRQRVALYTFGEPRTGNKAFASVFPDIFSFRVVHNGDIVSQLPPLNQSTYYHHNSELWYHNDMGANETYIQCNINIGEDETCSDSLNKTELNFADHKYYYGREFTDYGIQGCPDLVNVKHMNDKLF